MAPIVLDVTEPCPGCGGAFKHCPQPTDAMRAKAVSTRLDYVPIPPHYDPAPLEVVEELGELWVCSDCGMPHRVKPEEPAAPAKKK